MDADNLIRVSSEPGNFEEEGDVAAQIFIPDAETEQRIMRGIDVCTLRFDMAHTSGIIVLEILHLVLRFT